MGLFEQLETPARQLQRQEGYPGALVDEQMHKIDRWTTRYKVVEVEFAPPPFDPFFNAKRREDLTEAEPLFVSRRTLEDEKEAAV